MCEGQPSRTAERVAVERAAHQLLDSPLLLHDPFALRLISEAHREELEQHPERHDRSPLSRPTRAIVVVRTRIAEMGEPWRSFLRPEPLRTELLSLGFTSVDDVGATEINARYLACRGDELKARGVGRIAIARK